MLGIGLGLSSLRGGRQAAPPWSPSVLSSALWLKADAGIITDWAAKFTNASSQYLGIADNDSLSMGAGVSYTIAFWVWVNDLANSYSLVSKIDAYASNNAEFKAYCGGAPGIGFQVTPDGTLGSLVTTAGIPITANAWHFVVLWHDTALGQIFTQVDNAQFASSANVAQTHAGTSTFALGAQPGGQYLDGRLDSVGLWKRTLSSAERTTLFNAGAGKTYASLTAGEKVNLVSWWNLDEPSGTRNDSHGTNHLTDNNTVTYAAGIPADSLDGDPIGEWQDQSGNGRHLVQVTSSLRPALKLAIQNGLPVVRFDGVDDWLQATFTFNQPYTLYAVIIPRNNNSVLDGVTINSGLLYQPGTTCFGIFAGGDVGSGMAFRTLGTTYLIRCVFNGASSSIRLNADAAIVGDAGAANPGGITLGARGDFSAPCQVDIGEILALSGTVSVGNDTSVLAYLNGRWGVY